MKSLAEAILLDSQYVFRSSWGCIDVIFVVRELVEKAIVHNHPLFTLLIDLKKAYDSIPRCTMWLVLEKIGVSPKRLNEYHFPT